MLLNFWQHISSTRPNLEKKICYHLSNACCEQALVKMPFQYQFPGANTPLMSGCHPTNANKCISSFYFSFHFLISNVSFCSSPHFLVLNTSFYSLLYFFVSILPLSYFCYFIV